MAHKTSKKKKGKKPGHNPITHGRHPHRGKRPGHNPFRPERGGTRGGVETVLGAVAAAVIPDVIETSFLPQFNSGFLGYLSDGVLGGAILWIGGKFVGKDFAKGALAGIGVKVSIRALQDIGTSPHNAIAANVRDAQANQAANAAAAPAVNGPQQMAMGAPKPYRFNAPPSYALGPGGYSQSPTLGRPVPVRRMPEVRARY